MGGRWWVESGLIAPEAFLRIDIGKTRSFINAHSHNTQRRTNKQTNANSVDNFSK